MAKVEKPERDFSVTLTNRDASSTMPLGRFRGQDALGAAYKAIRFHKKWLKTLECGGYRLTVRADEKERDSEWELSQLMQPTKKSKH